MMNFKGMENKLCSMKAMTVFLSILFLSGIAVAQEENLTSEDFTTEFPDQEFQLHTVDSISGGDEFSEWDSGYYDGWTNEGDYISITPKTYPTYATGFEYEGRQISGESQSKIDNPFRGELTVRHDISAGNVQYELVVFEDADMDEIRYSYTLGFFTETTGIESETMTWDEQDIQEDDDGDNEFDLSDTETTDSGQSHYVGISVQGIDLGDKDIYEFDFDYPETSYTETLYNGTISTNWNTLPTFELEDEYDEDADANIVEGGTAGDYHLEISTTGFYGIEYGFDEPVSGEQLSYWNVDLAVENNGIAYYGFNSGEDTNTPYGITEGIMIDGENNVVRPISEGEIYSEDEVLQDVQTGEFNKYYQTVGGYWGGNDVFSTSPLLNGNQEPYEDLDYYNRYWYWGAYDSGWFSGDWILPNDLTGKEYESVVLLQESTDGDPTTIGIDDITYDTTASEQDVSEPIEIGTTPIDGVEDRNEIIDGGIIDNAIREIANFLGIGLTPARFLLGLLVSLGVGLAVGWNDEYGSVEIGMAGFGATFFSLIFVGLIPMLFGLIFLLLLVPLIWIGYKNQKTKVNV